MMAYGARVGLELGADIVKMKYGNKKPDLKWAVKCAGKTKIVISGGVKKDEKQFLKQVKDVVDAGAIGLAIGRNIWQSENPMKITKEIKKIIWK
jgi:class I fructose-bisphosphate aldolase